MFSYIMLGTNDLPGAIRFYNPLMEWLTSSLTGNKCCQHYLFEISSRITFFLSGFSIIKNSGYYSSRKYLSTLTEALMLENVIIR